MNILICASEAAPFAKTGGLADVIGALPKALKANGVDARVIMPYYSSIKRKNLANYIGYAYVNIANRSEYVGIFHAVESNVDFYFIDSERYFSRDALYGYGDDGERFSYFDFAVLEAIKVIGFYPDVIHCNDWQTGLIPYLLKSNYFPYQEYQKMKTVYSIHNIQYQGIFPKDILNILYMPYSQSLEYNNCINFMKCAIMESSIVTTVSPTYKNEVLTDQYGYSLNNILGLRYYDFYGIINGIDNKKYDPSTDPNIFKNYTAKNYKAGKKENKIKLLEQFGLDNNPDVPVFGLVSRLVDQKGIELLMPILDEIICNTNAKFILMGNGDKVYEDYFFHMEKTYPDRFKCYVGYSDPVAQKIYAGCDLFLMPSKFEPCGLGQMIAMRYGTLPLVRETGGLKDTVSPFNQFTNEGNGFSFGGFEPNALKDVMYLAINTFNDNKAGFDQLIKNAINMDYSWSNSAQQYIEIYNKAINK